MEIVIVDTAKDVAITASNILIDDLRVNRDLVLGLPTGNTVKSFYKELIDRSNIDSSISFKDVRTFNLDEYVGIASDHPCSYNYFMQENLFNHIDIRDENIHIPCGDVEDVEVEVLKYDLELQQVGKMDIVFLGIGQNGHIGFNEPGSSPVDSGVRVIKLSDDTRTMNTKHFPENFAIPTHANTIGISNIMSAKKVVLMAFGIDKASIIADSFNGKVNPMIPASILKRHPDCTIVIDTLAASRL